MSHEKIEGQRSGLANALGTTSRGVARRLAVADEVDSLVDGVLLREGDDGTPAGALRLNQESTRDALRQLENA